MEATKILKTLYNVRNFVNPIVGKDLDALILDLEAEARSKEQTVDERKQLAALRRFGKQCAKEMRESLAGAFQRTVGGKERWCLCDGIVAVVFDNVDGIPRAAVSDSGLDMDKIISPAKYSGDCFNFPSYSDVKAAFDLAKAAHTGKAKDFKHETTLGNGATVNTKKLLLFMEMLGIDGCEVCQDGIRKPIYANGNGVEGVLLPILK